jgi:hypothetical protein
VIVIAQLNDRTPHNFARCSSIGKNGSTSGTGHDPSA